jgi:hypothetical protein
LQSPRSVQPAPQNDRFYQELNAKISALPAEARHDVVFALFSVGLKMMDRSTILGVREQLLRQFSHNDDASAMGTVLIEILDGHLALRDLRHEFESAASEFDDSASDQS